MSGMQDPALLAREGITQFVTSGEGAEFSFRDVCSRLPRARPFAQQIRVKSQHKGDRNGLTHGPASHRVAPGFRCRRHPMTSRLYRRHWMREPFRKPINKQMRHSLEP